MASSTLPHFDLGNTFGSLFVGAILAAVLFGVGTIQAFIYFQTHKSTGITFFKLVVFYLWMIDALHLAFIVYGIYYYLVISYANFEALTEVVWSGKLQVVLAIFIVWNIHLLYAYRIWLVSKGRSKVLPITVGIIMTLDLGVSIVTSWKVYQCHQFTDFLGMEWSILLCLITVALTDFVIASSLCYLLATSRTGFPGIDSFLTTLMVYTINTGCLTSMCSVAACITCAVMPSKFIYMAIQFIVAKLYVNSFLALMNTRYYQRPYTDAVELHVRSDVYHPYLRTDRKPEDERLHTSQLKMSGYSYFDELHLTRPDRVVMP